MTIFRFSTQAHRLDRSFLAEQLKGPRSSPYFIRSLFEVAHGWLMRLPDVRIVCGVDVAPEALSVAQVREARRLVCRNDRSIEAESLPNRER